MNEISFSIDGDFIELHKLLKVCNLCESGGAAKYAVSQSLVKVDGLLETRKAFKVRKGRRVEYAGHAITVQ